MMSIIQQRAGRDPVPLKAALLYAKLGWKVLFARVAIDPEDGKKDIRPLTSWKTDPKGVTSDPNELRKQYKKGAIICIPTGVNGLGVLDTDVGEDGENVLFDLELKYGMLPDNVLKVRTATGGYHRIMRDSKSRLKSTAKVVGSGIDTRGVGGMIIAAPSLMVAPAQWSQKAGRYTFVNLEDFGLTKWQQIDRLDLSKLAEVPDWIVELAGEATQKVPADRQPGDERPARPGTIPEPAFAAAYTAEELREALSLLDVKQYELYGDWAEVMLVCTHATVCHDGREVFLDWCTENNTNKWTKERAKIGRHFDKNLRNRNKPDGLKVGTLRMWLRDAQATTGLAEEAELRKLVASDPALANRVKARRKSRKPARRAISTYIA